jgi:hypothetical protein
MKLRTLEIAMGVWAIGLGLILVVAFSYTIWSMCTGNYTGTACREF